MITVNLPASLCHSTHRPRRVGRMQCLCVAVLLAATASAFDAAVAAPQGTLVFNNVNTIDAVNGLQSGMAVVVQGNRITRVAAASELKLAENATIIDGTRKYLIPGLWDAHVHLSFEPDITPAMFKLFLVNGITSIRDTGGQLELIVPWRERAREDPQNTPRVMLAGPLLDGKPLVYDGSSPGRPELGVAIGSVAEAERLVDEMATAGVDLIKSYEMLSPEVFRALIDRARSKGLQVTGHVPLSMDVISASNAGLRSMEHLRNLEMSCSAYSEQLLKDRRHLLQEGANDRGGVLRSRIHQAQRTRAVNTQDEATRKRVLNTLAENGTWQIPTLTVVIGHRLHTQPAWRDTFKYLPESAHQRWIGKALRSSATPRSSARNAYAQWAYDMIGHLSKAGVGIMAGTDCPIVFLTPGFSLHEELGLLVKGGLTPLQALESATLKPAQYFKMDHELGTIAENMLADLILLDANPLDDIRNTTRVNSVVRDGRLHDRKALDQMLKELEAE